MMEKPRGRLLSMSAVLFALLAVSNLSKPFKLWGDDTGFVLLGQRLEGIANAVVGPIFGLYLLVYTFGIWHKKRFALPMAYAYAAYVIVNLVLFISSQPPSSEEGRLLFGLVYAVVAIGISSGTVVLLTKCRATLS